MKNQPLVSVLMPSYNSEKFIGIAIQSVLNSTYTNFELIVTDDNSTDNTYYIAKSFEEKDKRVKVYLNDKNYGDYPNRNKAASYAKGIYLKYVDHDDFIYPYGLEQLVHYMEQFPDAGYGLCSLDQDDNQIYPFELNPEEAYIRNYFQSSLFHKAPLSSIIKRDAFESVGGFTGKPFLGDFEFWHIISQKYKLVLMPQGIVWYRRHENQESKKLEKNSIQAFNYLVFGKQLVESEECPLDKISKRKVIDDYENKQVKAILSAGKHHSIKKALELKKESGMSFLTILKKILR
jgi:glycosyltransferase involved in cell wall biosynthesis